MLPLVKLADRNARGGAEMVGRARVEKTDVRWGDTGRPVKGGRLNELVGRGSAPPGVVIVAARPVDVNLP